MSKSKCWEVIKPQEDGRRIKIDPWNSVKTEFLKSYQLEGNNVKHPQKKSIEI